MNPSWKKAYYDVVSKEDLEKWYEVETALNQKLILTHFHHLPQLDMNEIDPARLAFLLEDESWGDPQDDEFYDDSWDLTGYFERVMLYRALQESSLNQVLDESVDFSGDPEYFFNMNEFLKAK